MRKRKVLFVYTGGTIGMVQDRETGALLPFSIEKIMEALPSLKTLDVEFETHCFETLIDSSDMGPEGWIRIAQIIEEKYEAFDGFVVLHGTDTMAYTASALSFMFDRLQKPVILTGSQLPIGVLRSDGKDNLINATEMASSYNEEGYAMAPEVCVCFENNLFRGNRISKQSAEYFNAFASANFPPLAKVGVHIKWNTAEIDYSGRNQKFSVSTSLERNVMIVKVHPGLSENALRSVLSIPNLRGVVLETYGSGNAPTSDWFGNVLEEAIQRGLIIINVSQCMEGSVEMGKYAASTRLKNIGVVNGYDITSESALAKLMFLLGKGFPTEEILKKLSKPLRGEMSV